MATDPGTVLRRWFDEVWNQGREDVVDELFAAQAVGHGLGEGEIDVHGPTKFKVFLRNMRSALPDVQIHVKSVLVDGDHGAVRLVLEGTHLGDGLGIPPTGRRVSIAGIVMTRVVGGQIVEGWNSWDQLGLLKQLGALPVAQEPDRFLEARAGTET